jgi:hypothetical protein
VRARIIARLVEHGHVHQLSIGNGFAVHDIERDLYGTSLGVNTETLDPARHGHEHHIYAISEIVRAAASKRRSTTVCPTPA